MRDRGKAEAPVPQKLRILNLKYWLSFLCWLFGAAGVKIYINKTP